MRSYRCWTAPSRRLCQLIPVIQRGDLPVSVLSDLTGGVQPIALAVQAMAIELRRQRGEVRKLEQELRDRIANRTEALERALGSLKQKAARDPLTGLFNRRVMDEHLSRLIERRRGADGNLSLLMIDVDHFKMLNDSLGHAAGDELLKSIGQLIRSAIRTDDMAFRCGGDEFVVVLDSCTADDARRLADRMVQLVDGLTRTLKVPCPPRLSIGVSTLASLGEASTSAMLREADRQLYRVKGAVRRHWASRRQTVKDQAIAGSDDAHPGR